MDQTTPAAPAAPAAPAWSEAARRAFWTFVRGRMAEEQLENADLARALNLSSPNVSRRLHFKVKERPSQATVRALARVLKLDRPGRDRERETLFHLAGYGAAPNQPAAPAPGSGTTHSVDDPSPRSAVAPLAEDRAGGTRTRPGWWRRRNAVAALGAIAIAVLAPLIWYRAAQRPLGRRLPESGYAVSIAPIASEATAGSFVPVRGSLADVPGDVGLWVVVEHGGYYWPQRRAVRFGTTWVGHARIGSGAVDAGKTLQVLAVLVNQQADSLFQEWLDAGNRLHDYPPLSGLPSGARAEAGAAVTVR